LRPQTQGNIGETCGRIRGRNCYENEWTDVSYRLKTLVDRAIVKTR